MKTRDTRIKMTNKRGNNSLTIGLALSSFLKAKVRVVAKEPNAEKG